MEAVDVQQQEMAETEQVIVEAAEQLVEHVNGGVEEGPDKVQDNVEAIAKQESSGGEHMAMVDVALEEDNGITEQRQEDRLSQPLSSLVIEACAEPSFEVTFPSESPIGQAISEDLPESSSDEESLNGNDEDDTYAAPCLAPQPPPPPMNHILSYELSRDVMFNKYANAIPSTQEQQQQQQQVQQPSSWVAFDSLEAFNDLPCDPMDTCHNVACQELMRWKDARIHELQRALDQMVESMAIQQRDLAAQRALLTRQSEHFTKLSLGLQHEKMTLQLNRERTGGVNRMRTQRSRTSLALDRTDTPRRGTMPHARSLPSIPPPSDVSAFKAVVTTRHSMMPTIPLTVLPLDDHHVVELGTEKSKSLSALEIRATTPQMPTIHEIDKFATDDTAPPALLSEVSLHEREPSTATSTATSDSSSDLLRSDAPTSTPASSDSVKKWSLGGRLRSIRWKP